MIKLNLELSMSSVTFCLLLDVISGYLFDNVWQTQCLTLLTYFISRILHCFLIHCLTRFVCSNGFPCNKLVCVIVGETQNSHWGFHSFRCRQAEQQTGAQERFGILTGGGGGRAH